MQSTIVWILLKKQIIYSTSPLYSSAMASNSWCQYVLSKWINMLYTDIMLHQVLMFAVGLF